MSVEVFRFASLEAIDEGRIREAWEQALRRVRLDCADRPGVKRPRKVTLTMSMTPVSSADGSLDTVDVQFHIDEALPKRVSHSYNMKSVEGGLLFNEMSRDDVRQRTLDELHNNGPKEAIRDAQ